MKPPQSCVVPIEQLGSILVAIRQHLPLFIFSGLSAIRRYPPPFADESQVISSQPQGKIAQMANGLYRAIVITEGGLLGAVWDPLGCMHSYTATTFTCRRRCLDLAQIALHSPLFRKSETGKSSPQAFCAGQGSSAWAMDRTRDPPKP